MDGTLEITFTIDPIGIEMLRPGHLEILVSQVAKKYHIPAINEAVNSIRTALACA